MATAILEGRKTSTRRIIKRTPSNDEPCGYGFWKEYEERDERWYVKDYTHSCCWYTLEEYIKKWSRYHVGDILYVRETWQMQSMSNFDKRAKFLYKAEPNEKLKEVILAPEKYDDLLKYSYKHGWQPSLFMPKEAARIFLKVTDVKIERLQSMSARECLKEGVNLSCYKENYICSAHPCDFKNTVACKDKFKDLWDSTVNKKDIDMYGWDADPWVWVIQFEKTDKI